MTNMQNNKSDTKNTTGTQGGSREQHAKAGAQSHKNDAKSTASTTKSSGGNR